MTLTTFRPKASNNVSPYNLEEDVCNSNDDLVLMNSNDSAPKELDNNVEFGTCGNYENKSEEEGSGDKSRKEEGSGKEG